MLTRASSESTQCMCTCSACVGLSLHKNTKNWEHNDCDEKWKTPLWLMAGETLKSFLLAGLSNNKRETIKSKFNQEEGQRTLTDSINRQTDMTLPI